MRSAALIIHVIAQCLGACRSIITDIAINPHTISGLPMSFSEETIVI
jgi:hypothetical protein